MNQAVKPMRLFIAPAPRAVADIFSAADLARLRDLGEVYLHEDGVVDDAIFDAHVVQADIVVGQFDLPVDRLNRMKNLRAIVNVEGNFLPNVDYAQCFRQGVRVLNVSPVFAEPVAEAALGMAIDLARGISQADRRFRHNSEQYGLEANRDAFSLYEAPIGSSAWAIWDARSCHSSLPFAERCAHLIPGCQRPTSSRWVANRRRSRMCCVSRRSFS
jgi:lactate dehydrogenase-like 2-hydroxyacid dehydrogenase